MEEKFEPLHDENDFKKATHTHNWVTDEMVKKMQAYAIKMRRKFPYKKPLQIAKMVQKRFKVSIIDERGSTVVSSNGTQINS